MTVARTCRTYD